MSWTRWPHPTAVPDAVLSAEVEKSASAVQHTELSVESMLQGVVEEIPTWELELPRGIEKFAAARFGSGDELPAVTRKNIWRHPNAHPLALTLLLADRYAPDFLSWEPEALRSTLKKDDTQLSDGVWTKILAARVIMMSPSPWRQWEQFHWVSYGLAGRAPNFVYLEKPELGFSMAAVDTMKIVDRTRPWAEDVDKYVATVLREIGSLYAPAPVQFAQEELSDRRLKCRACGTLEKDDHDIKCVACGSKDLDRVAGPFDNLKEPTATLFEARKKMPLEEAVQGLPETAVGNAVYRLLVHNEYRNEVRAQLLAQLRMLRKES